ncbi:glycoside hydrolase family 6 protein [Myxococcus stipitatus]|nr:glycoside hydrolase family 6 protein [Myxococcus stipitatus]MCE9666435.1 glycoside hydrolase family 6 protein [Myxococcus stipitatus]QRV71503.1 endo-beta-1,4-glucanase [Myxococcus sp.]
MWLAASLLVACGEPLVPGAGEDAPGTSRAALTELVVNGTFANGVTTPWWSGANTQSLVENGRLRVNVAGGTVNRWDALIGQDDIPLVSGRAYTLAFTASASANVPIRATVQIEPSPYTATLDQTVTLDGTARRFTFPFTSSLGTSLGQVTFQFGGSGAFTLYLDDITLTTETGSGPIALTSGFYVDPNSNPAVWVNNNGGDARAARIQAHIASKPGARWFGNWSGDIASAVSGFVSAADAADKLPVLVAYNIPGRDCGSHSSGGAGSPEAYRAWISSFVTGLGTRPAIVIIEPDAVAQLDCLPNDTERQTRLGLLRYATEQLRDRAPNTWAYLDGGNATWIAADTLAQRLESGGVRNIRGFSLNVSNYIPTAQSNTYGAAVSAALNTRYGYTKPWVVDTSRNGNGSNGEWCNPAGRKLGVTSQVGGGADLLLWIKVPGDSDGQCGIAPTVPAGTFSPDLAIRLIDGT